MDLEIEQTLKNCAGCQQVRKPPAVAPLAQWMWASNPWHEFVLITLRMKTVIIAVSLMSIPAGHRSSLWHETRQLTQRSPSSENFLRNTDCQFTVLATMDRNSQ